METALHDTREKVVVPEAYPARVFETMHKLVPLTRCRHVLDAGCGTGEVTRLVARKFAFVEVQGVDRDEIAIAQAKANYAPRVRFLAAELCDLRPKERFEAITAFNAFHEFGNDTLVMENFRKLLPAGGLLFAADTYFPADTPSSFRDILVRYQDPAAALTLAYAREMRFKLRNHGFLGREIVYPQLERWRESDALCRVESLLEWRVIRHEHREDARAEVAREIHTQSWDGGYLDLPLETTLIVAEVAR